jgi:hypothetical protein
VAQDGCFNEKTEGGKSRDTVYETGPRKMYPAMILLSIAAVK